MNGLGLYIHIPFCATKCSYCDFASFPGQMHLREAYVSRLTEEIASRGEVLQHPEADSLFIGGGTPSLLMPGQMERVLRAVREHFPLSPGAEITCEANPGSLTGAFLDVLAAHGVNRLSLGAQSAEGELLRTLGRRHSWQDVARSVDLIRSKGILNINIDLMMGIPGQSLKDWRDTLEAVLQLHPQHLSCYGLIVEEGTPMAEWVEAGDLELPDEETERAMYDTALTRLEEAGYHQYEISNFALPGYHARHNLACWQRKDYHGFGSAAHSLEEKGRLRLSNPESISDYLKGAPPEKRAIGPEEAMFESVMLGLRITKGLDLAAFELAHGRAFQDVYGVKAEPSIAKGLSEYRGGHFRLTRRGMDVMNQVLLDFM